MLKTLSYCQLCVNKKVKLCLKRYKGAFKNFENVIIFHFYVQRNREVRETLTYFLKIGICMSKNR